MQQQKRFTYLYFYFQINYIRKYSDTMKNTTATITRDGTGTYILLKNGFKTLLKARYKRFSLFFCQFVFKIFHDFFKVLQFLWQKIPKKEKNPG